MKTLDVHWSVGLALLTARRSVGWTQEQLADELVERGLAWSQSKVSAVERGVQPLTVDELLALRDLFGLDLHYWVDGPIAGHRAIPGQLKPMLKPAA